jgi:glycosyltransferase involved in cell wall biosynthesis
MARALARKGYLFFFCTDNEMTDAVVGFQQIEPLLYLCHVPLETFSGVEQPIVYIGGAPWHRNTLPLFDRPRVVYDHYDDLEVSTGRRQDHQVLLEVAEVAVITSQRLMEAGKEYRPDAVLVPNGVDYAYIQAERPGLGEAAPVDWEAIVGEGKPIIGYSGALARWFDYGLIHHAAKARPDVEFVFIGVNYDGSLDSSGMLDLPNVHWLGMKDYDELFKYVWRFDIAVIPFRINDITLATSPIKLFEYMACQKPVVSTALPECKRYEDVFVANTHEEFVQKMDEALAARRDQTYLSRIDRLAKDHTWDSRAETIHCALKGGTAAAPEGNRAGEG